MKLGTRSLLSSHHQLIDDSLDDKLSTWALIGIRDISIETKWHIRWMKYIQQSVLRLEMSACQTHLLYTVIN